MNRRGFFAALLAPVAGWRPVDWKGRVDLEEMYEGKWLVVDGQARSITGWNDNAQVVFANPEDVDVWGE